MKTATIIWRESVTDLATDLQALLTRAQLIDLCDALAVSAARASRGSVNPMHLLGDPASFDEAEADPPSLASARPVSAEHLEAHAPPPPPEPEPLAPDVEPETCGCEESLWLRARIDALSTKEREPDGDPPLSVSVPGAVVAWLDSLTKRYHEVQMGTAELRIRAYEFGTEDDGRVSFEVDVEQRTTEGFSGPVR